MDGGGNRKGEGRDREIERTARESQRVWRYTKRTLSEKESEGRE